MLCGTEVFSLLLFPVFALVVADFVETPLALYLKNKYDIGKATIGQGSDTWMERVT